MIVVVVVCVSYFVCLGIRYSWTHDVIFKKNIFSSTETVLLLDLIVCVLFESFSFNKQTKILFFTRNVSFPKGKTKYTFCTYKCTKQTDWLRYKNVQNVQKRVCVFQLNILMIWLLVVLLYDTTCIYGLVYTHNLSLVLYIFQTFHLWVEIIRIILKADASFSWLYVQRVLFFPYII